MSKTPLTAPIYHDKHPQAPRLDPADEFAQFYLITLSDDDIDAILLSRKIRVGLQQLPNGKLVCGFEPV